MYDRSLAQDSLLNIKEALTTICERMVPVRSVDDFLLSPEGMLRLDAICMNLIALGEAVKGLDKITKGELLTSYPEIYWRRNAICRRIYNCLFRSGYDCVSKDVH